MKIKPKLKVEIWSTLNVFEKIVAFLTSVWLGICAAMIVNFLIVMLFDIVGLRYGIHVFLLPIILAVLSVYSVYLIFIVLCNEYGSYKIKHFQKVS